MRAPNFDARFGLARERLLRITASLVDAEDVVQDTYLLGQGRVDQLRDGAAFDPWVTRIAVNLCFGRHRRMKRLREMLPALLPRKAPASDIGLRELVEKLPPRERTVLVLHYGHGYRLEEIAAVLRSDAYQRADRHRAHSKTPVRRLAQGGRTGTDGLLSPDRWAPGEARRVPA